MPTVTDDLRARAAEALHAQRIHAPAGDNAIDHYLALRKREPSNADVEAALVELQPYVLIAGEQALARADLAEAQRLFALLARIDAQAPALPRLRESLRLAQVRADQLEGAGAVSLVPASIPTPSAMPAPVAPKPVRASVHVAAITRASAATVLETPPVESAAKVAAIPPTPPPAASVERKPEPVRPLPRLLSDAAPRYPLTALNRKIEGSVQIAFTIQPDGSVAGPRLVATTPAGVFDEAALAAAVRWRFEATGQRVATSRTLTFRLPRD